MVDRLIQDIGKEIDSDTTLTTGSGDPHESDTNRQLLQPERGAVVGTIRRDQISGSDDASVVVFPSKKSGIDFLMENNAWGFVRIGQEPDFIAMYVSEDIQAVKSIAEIDEIVEPEEADLARPLEEVRELVEATPPEIESEIAERFTENGYRELFNLHMAYLLLWTVIDRFLTLRYAPAMGGGKERYNILEQFAKENEPFRDGIDKCIKSDGRVIWRSKDRCRRELDKTDPVKTIKFYWEVRSNVAHRGKSIYHDYEILRTSAEELLNIFDNYVLPEALGDPNTHRDGNEVTT